MINGNLATWVSWLLSMSSEIYVEHTQLVLVGILLCGVAVVAVASPSADETAAPKASPVIAPPGAPGINGAAAAPGIAGAPAAAGAPCAAGARGPAAASGPAAAPASSGGNKLADEEEALSADPTFRYGLRLGIRRRLMRLAPGYRLAVRRWNRRGSKWIAPISHWVRRWDAEERANAGLPEEDATTRDPCWGRSCRVRKWEQDIIDDELDLMENVLNSDDADDDEDVEDDNRRRRWRHSSRRWD